MDSIADSGTGGDAPTPITGASTDREDEDAGMGLLADGRRRREPQTITRPVPVLIRPAQAATSGTLTRPWPPPRHNFVELPRIQSERPAFELHYPHLLDRLQAEAHAGGRHEPYVSELVSETGPRQGPNDPDPT